MKNREILHTDLSVYSKTLSNGLKVYVVPKENCNNIYATFTTNYGAYQSEFVPYMEEQMVTVPEGVAHFLEHKLFAQEDGVDPFTFFGRSGASSNASTSTYRTMYLFEGENEFEENMNYLLDFVQEPYFTDENVEEEKGIIIQEIKMYQDNPFRMGYEKSLWNTFVKSPVRVPVGGSVESVSAITKEDLLTCYKTFYHPSNMVVVVTGCVKPESVIELVQKNQDAKDFGEAFDIKVPTYEEPDTVQKEKEVLKMNVTIPKVFINIKVPICSIQNLKIYEIIEYIGIFIESTFGTTSNFYERMVEEQILTDTIDFNLINAKTHIDIMIMAETQKVDTFTTLVLEEIEKRQISEKEFERKKKTMIASLVFMSDNIYRMNAKVVGDVLLKEDVECDSYNKIVAMSYEVEKDILRKANFRNYSIVVIEPKDVD